MLLRRDSRRERRRGTRRMTRLAVRFCEQRSLRAEEVVNISHGGLFVHSAFPLKEGCDVRMKLQLTPSTILHAEGEVVWHREPISVGGDPNAGRTGQDTTDDQAPATERQSGGMGIRFVNLTPETSQTLKTYLKSLSYIGEVAAVQAV